ncbi:hypothetical protein B188_00790 [Candidatus Brocadiaceae bacterium B188]|nr:hypothetical protein B188_00790 [Candidatus Brocadiaceae bacterium B188]
MNSLSLFVDKLWGSGYKPEPAEEFPLRKGGQGGCNSACILSRQNYYTFTMARCFYLFLNVFEGGEGDEAEG